MLQTQGKAVQIEDDTVVDTRARGEVPVCSLDGLTRDQIQQLKRQVTKLKHIDGISVVRGQLFVELNMGDLAGKLLADTAKGVIERITGMAEAMTTRPHASKSRSKRRKARRGRR